MTTIPRRVPRRERTPQLGVQTSAFVQTASKWYANYQLKKQIEIEQEGDKKDKTAVGYRKWLLDQIIKAGKVVDPTKGHKAIIFDEPIGDLYGLKAQRSASPEWNPVVAVPLLEKKGALAACTRVRWAFDPNQIPLIVDTLRTAGVLEECTAPGYPSKEIDPELVMKYHQLHKDVITEADIDLMMPDKETWSLITINEPMGDISDVD